MSKDKERKIFEIIGISFLTFVITLVGCILLLNSYMTSEIGEFTSRRSSAGETYNIGQEPGKFWGSFFLWSSLLLAIVGGLIYGIFKKIREFNDS
jgi:flagellar biosynthesis protein FliQ